MSNGISSHFYIGVVEDRNDPKKLGRLRVRIVSLHSSNKEELPTKDLPWAYPIQSITSSAMNGIGESPTGIVEGTHVIVFFADGEEKQQPMVFGTLGGIPEEKNKSKKLGFQDPELRYPKDSFLNEPDTNRLSRNEKIEETVVKNKKDTTRKGNSLPSGTWDEPETPYNSEYPYNHVKETESGHIKEYDDTPGKERIHEYHKSGTFYEVHPDGSKVTRIEGNGYSIVAGNDHVLVEGNINITVKGNANVKVLGKVDFSSDSDITIESKETLTLLGKKIDLNP